MIRQLRRDWRSSEMRLLLLALVVAVMAVTAVGFFADRIDRAMRDQATALFGADLIITSSRPLSPAHLALAKRLGLRSVLTVGFPSVALAGDESLLVKVKAVGQGYPLRGRLEVSGDPARPGHPVDGIPAAGEAWVEARVLHRLGLKLGDSLELGNSRFVVSRLITFEADAGGSAFQVAPRLMIALGDLPATGLLTPMSRARYKLLVAGAAPAVADYRAAVKPGLKRWERLQSVDDGRPEVSAALDRAGLFMRLALILTIVLAGVAVALAIRAFSRVESQNVAIWRTLGATRAWIRRHYLRRLAMLVLIATAIGGALGFAAQFVLAGLLGGWLGAPLPAASAWPLLAGLATALLTLFGFALPPLLALMRTPPMRILRAGDRPASPSVWLSLASMSLATFGFLVWQAGGARLAGLVFAGVLAVIAVMFLTAWLLAAVARRFAVGCAAGWRLGIANIARYRRRSALLMATFGVAFLVLVLLGGVREDLIDNWRDNLPDDAPNHFLVNIQQHELPGLRTFLRQRGIERFRLYPMVRGRLLRRNGAPIGPADYPGERARRLVSREFFLSAAEALPTANKLIAGRWPVAGGESGFSVESGIAETLGLKLGDTLGFDIAGRALKLPITSLREVQWDSMQPNFFVMAHPDALKAFAKSYITSVHVDDGDPAFTTDLVRRFPAVTDLDVRALLKQVRRIISQASAAVEFVFGFSLLAGVAVLLAAIQTQRAERRQEIAVLKTLGAGRRQLQAAVASEFLVLGALAGFLGSGLALLGGWLLATRVFNLDYRPSLLLWLAGALLGALVLGGIGWWVVRGIVRVSPTRLLREMR